jgi:type II secretory pathway component PulF
MATPETTNSIAGTAVRLAISALLWLTLLVALVFVVPGQRRMFDAYGVPVPNLTHLVIDISMWFADYWWVTIPFLLPLFFITAVLTWLVRYQIKSRFFDALWTLVLIGLPFALIAIVWLSLYTARIKLIEGLAR